jgi:hypothetical protein
MQGTFTFNHDGQVILNSDVGGGMPSISNYDDKKSLTEAQKLSWHAYPPDFHQQEIMVSRASLVKGRR